MTDEYVSLPFFKTNTLYTCSWQFLMSKVVKFLRDTNLRYINFEPDLWIANLRTAKKSYQPIRFFKKYRMKLGEIGSINTVMPLNSLSGGHFSFAQRVRYEFMSTVNLYLDIFKQPSLIFLWLLQLIRDIFYELPRSLFYKKRHESLEQHLQQSASQALTISEIVTIPGNVGIECCIKPI
jgi:hypothetical protein